MILLLELLSWNNILIWGGALFLCWYIVFAIVAYSRLRHIPGPFLGRISYLPHLYNIYTARVRLAYEDIHNKFASGGPFVVIAPRTVITNDPDVLRHIAAARSIYKRDDWYRAARFHRKYDSIASMVDTEEHDRAKAKTASGYSGREVGAQFEPAIDAVIASLVGLIKRKHLSSVEKDNLADISFLLRIFTLDVITRLGYGKSFGHLDEGTDRYGFLSQTDAMYKPAGLILEIPLFRNIVYRMGLFSIMAPQLTDASGAGKIMGLVHELISERFSKDAQSTKWNDMIGGFIRNGLSQNEVEGEATLQIFAGSETTAVALSATIMHLAASPRAYMRLKQEISSAISSGLVSRESPISFEQAQKLPYLQAVIWEGFRIGCPVHIGHYKVVPPGGDTVAGVFLPGGIAVGHNSLALTKNPAVFGDSVNVFRPERFLECDDDTRTRRLRALDIVFGGGRWMCSGKTVALFELNKVTFELMRAFDFQVANPMKAWEEKNYLMPVVSKLMVQITQADPDSSGDIRS